jgi:hypothetical protein
MSTDIVKKLDESIQLGVEASKLQGFEKMFQLGRAIDELKNHLTDEAMRPIMKLQGYKLGFRTDKDSDGGYPMQVVKNCLIEAVLIGVQPVNNHFNIIAGNCYITKEGFGYLLKNIPNLNYEIVPRLPRINQDKTSAAIFMKITWSIKGGEEQTREIEFPIKVNKFMGPDAIIGKATRKARAWLYNTVTDNEVSEGDVQDITYEDVTDKKQPKIDTSKATSNQLNLERKEDESEK